MHKYIFLILLCTSHIHSMQQEKTPIKSQGWDSQAYSQANTFQEKVALTMLFNSPLKVKGKRILDMGCGTGNISAFIAQKAHSVYGIDADENMINHAQKTYNDSANTTTYRHNLKFEHCCAEKFRTQEPFDAVTSFNCIHWIQDKDAVLASANKALKVGGTILGNVRTAPSPNLDLVVVKELSIELIQTGQITKEDIINLTNTKETDPTIDIFKYLLEKNNFKVSYCEEVPFEMIFENREAVEKLYRPIVMAHPITRLLPQEKHESIFARFIELMVEKMNKNERGYHTSLITTVFHAYKMEDV